ncbi:hypothetical protein AB4Y96_11005 [Phyllobacterium sp. TAF24]|uniref:hypothetical protein n=1 Tax=unclassified Phyllobacterium TaxID=2638441 RepID=UPI00087F6988|nr:hypothetical protein [Phyllobacterium sp. OV277]SDP00796.1 hypothetical protein SAMN05443582_103142 [Phyllobacterium sp. OV277]
MSIVLASLGAIFIFAGIGGAFIRIIMLIVKARSFHPELPDKRARLAHDRSVIRAGLGTVFGLLGLAIAGLVLLLIA